MSQPKVLLYDLETGGVNALRADLGFVLCFGYKWLGEKRVHVLKVSDYRGWFNKESSIDDKPILEDALGIIEEANLLVAHYGDKFDRRFLQGRCAVHNLEPPPPTKQRDTWRIAKTAFNFSSNRLGQLAKTLGLSEQKQEKNRRAWPGWWLRAMSGDIKAIDSMARYCAQDVRTLEQVYLRIRQYDNPHPRLVEDRAVCRLCEGEIQYRGWAYVGENRYRRYKCFGCGRWDRERKKLI